MADASAPTGAAPTGAIVHRFEESLARGEAGEAIICDALARWYEVRPVTRTLQRRGVDRILLPRSHPDRPALAVELKWDERAATTGNAFVETVSVSTDGKLGWAMTSGSDFIIYGLPHLSQALVIPTERLQSELPRLKDRYPAKWITNRSYETQGILVPIPVLARLARYILPL